MNYEQACARLNTPRKKNSKKLGHKLLLFYSGRFTDIYGNTNHTVTLQYFNTHIITWRHDGSVLINAEGYWDSRVTIDKLNEYSPRGWRIQQHCLSHEPKLRCASLDIRSDTWELVRSMPYADGAIYYEDGRSGFRDCPLENIEACSVVRDVAVTVEESVMAFLRGELRRPRIEEDLVALDVDEAAGIVEKSFRRSELIVDIAKSKAPRAELVWAVIDTEYKYSYGYLPQLQLYDPAHYPFTGKPRTNKEHIAQMEHFLRVGNNHTRWLKNSPRFHEMKRELKISCEVFLLRELGFQVKEFERRERALYR